VVVLRNKEKNYKSGGNVSNIEDLRVYKNSLVFSDKIWDICLKWDNLAKNTVGYQIVKSADSISANLAEGYGRFHIQDNIHFCYYNCGSLKETKDWLRKSKNRKIINEKEYNELYGFLIIAKQLNKYISSLKSKTKKPMNQQP
jgi:four helix bundle protein